MQHFVHIFYHETGLRQLPCFSFPFFQNSSSPSDNLQYLPDSVSDPADVCDLQEVKDYQQAVERLCNDGEDVDTIKEYKMAVTQVLGLRSAGAKR